MVDDAKRRDLTAEFCWTTQETGISKQEYKFLPFAALQINTIITQGSLKNMTHQIFKVLYK